MNIFDEARSIRGMLSMRGMTQQQLAVMLGVSQPYIANKLRLLRYSEENQQKITSSGISERHARTLLRLEGDKLDEALDIVIRAGMTTAQTELLVDRLIDEGKQRTDFSDYETDAERVIQLEDMIEGALVSLRRFGTRAALSKERFGNKTYLQIVIEAI